MLSGAHHGLNGHGSGPSNLQGPDSPWRHSENALEGMPERALGGVSVALGDDRERRG
jgi:hypothetical protein